jgi:hypothetical protein
VKRIGASVASVLKKVHYRLRAKKAFQSHDLTSLRKQKSLSLFNVVVVVVVAVTGIEAVVVATVNTVVDEVNVVVLLLQLLTLQLFCCNC